MEKQIKITESKLHVLIYNVMATIELISLASENILILRNDWCHFQISPVGDTVDVPWLRFIYPDVLNEIFKQSTVVL